MDPRTLKEFMRFQFDGLSYNDLVRLFVQSAGKPLLGEVNIPGELTFYDVEPYTYEEAFDTLNTLLAMKGFWLVEGKRYFRVVKVDEIPHEAKILQGMAEMAGVRPKEVVTVVVPLQFLDATTASKAVVRMVSPWGSISPLTKGKGLIITDSAENIRKITDFLALLDTEGTTDRQIETIKLKNASARNVAQIVTTLFGGSRTRKWYRNPVTGRYEIDPTADTGAPVTATPDDRTNSIILISTSDRLAMAKSMIEQLDQEGAEAGGTVRIFKLKNAKAQDVAQIITAVFGGSTSSAAPSYSRYESSRYSRYSSPEPTVGSTPVRVVPDTAGNRVIVTAPADKLVAIEKLIKDIDTESGDMGGTRIFRLKSADAQQLVSILTATLQVTSRDRYGRTSTTGARVTADPRSNSLIVAGSAADMTVAESIITELDKEGAEDPREIHVVHLKAGDARQVAQALLSVFGRQGPSPSYSSRYSRYPTPSSAGGGSSIRVEADTTTNTLLIACAPGDWPRIQKILDELQASMDTLATPVTKRVPLKAAKAEELAETLREIYGGAASSRFGAYGRYSRYGSSRYGQPAGGTGGQTVPVRIVAERNTNSLIITASEEDHVAIGELIKALDVEATAKVDPIRLVRLKNAQATKVAATLQAMLPPPDPRLGRPEVFIQADALTNSLILRAPESQRKTIEEMIATLDAATVVAARETRIIPLKHISAREVVTMLAQLYPATSGAGSSPSFSRYSRYRRSYMPAASGEDAERVVITPAPGDRALVVDAPKTKIEEIAQLVASLDTEDAPGRVEVRTYDLGELKAADVAATLANVYARQRGYGRGGDGDLPDPRFEANAATNQLLVAATAAQFEEIEKTLKTLKEAPRLATETRTFQLKFAKAVDLVDVLRTMLAESGASGAAAYTRSRYSPYGRYGRAASTASTGQIRVAALEGANALVVQGPPEKLALAEKLIASFDVPDMAAGSTITRLPLKNARAEVLVETLRGMLPPTPRGEQPPVVIEAETGTNSILLRGVESERLKIEAIITQLDKDTTDQTREVRIIPLKHASAAALVMMFEQLYTGGTVTSYGGYGRYRGGRYGRPAPSGTDDRVVVTAAPGDKAIVVEAPKNKIEEIAQLITSLDVENAPGNIEVRTYQLTSAKATDLADSLSRLFSSSGGGGRYRQPTPGAPQQPEPRFEADEATNQLMVAATVEQFVEIEKVIEKLKAATVLASQTRTFLLKHARATEIVGVLETMLTESGSSPSYSRYRSPYSSRGRRGPTGATGQVRVAAVESTNAVVVQGPAEKIQLAETLIKGFDTPEAAGASVIRLVPLANARAETLVTMLEGMLPPPARGEEQQVSIQADPLTNSVLLRAPESQRRMLEEMIATLDKTTPSQAREMRILPLKHASASALAETLTQLFASESPQPGRAFSRFGRFGSFGRTRTVSPGGNDARRVIITAAPGDKALIVDAPKDRMEEIVATVTKLDTDQAGGLVQVRTYPVPNGRAAELAESLSRLFGADQRGAFRGRGGSGTESPAPKFDADPSGRQLLVAATSAQFVEIDKVIQDLKVTTEGGIETRTFPLKFARATELVEVLETMLTDSAQGGSASRFGRFGARRTPSSAGSVRVAAIEASNAIVVQGPPEKLALAEQLVKTFDEEKAGKQMTIEIVKLANAEAPSLAEAVNTALAARAGASGFGRGRRTGAAAGGEEPKVTVTAETNSNSILVRGPADEVRDVVAMIKRLDEQGDSRAVQVKTYKLENSSAVELAKTVGTLFKDIVRQQSGGARGRAAAAPVPFSCAGDERTNTLVVHTTASYFKVVEEILKTLDQTGPLRDVRFFYLVNADAYDVADKLDAMFADKRGAAKPVISVDELSNTVSVVARDADMKAIEDVVLRLDESTPMDEEPIVRIIPLTQIRASRMAEFLYRVYSQMTDAEVVLEGDTAPKSPLVVPAPGDANRPLLPGVAPGAGDTELFPPAALPPGPGTQPAGGATSRPTSRPTSQPARPKRRVTIAVDRNSNSLIIMADRQELENIQTVIDRLSSGAQDADAEIRIIKLKDADPVSVAQTIDSLFNPRSRQPQPQQQRGQPQQRGRGGSRGQQPQQRQPQQPPQLPKPTVVVVPEVRTRSIIVRAKPYDLEIVEQLVRQLDRVPIVVSEVKIFTLKNTDATEVASNIAELFTLAARSSGAASQAPSSPSSRGRTSPTQQRAEWVRQMLSLQNAGGVMQVDPATAVTLTANRGTNSVIVTAPAEVMKLIQQIIEELDQSTATVRSVRMYPLKHAEVAPTVTALKEIFASTTARAPTTAGRGRMPGAVGRASSGGGPDAPIIITGDEAGRMVIVSAPEEKHELVAKVIEEIDKAQEAGNVAVKVYRLEHADAQSVASALSGTLTASGRGAGTSRRGTTTGGTSPAGQIRIQADRSSNSLVVRASEEDHQRITRLLSEMDSAPAELYPVRTIALTNADADDVAATITALFASGRGGAASARTGRGRGGTTGATGRTTAGGGMIVEADARAGLLLIRADDETFKKVQEVVAKLDVVSAQQPVVKMYDVRNAEVATVVAALQQIFGASGASGTARGGRTRRTAGGAAPGEAPVVAIGDEGARKVIVSAPAEKHELIAQTIQQIDAAQTAGDVTVKVYRLENADATTVASALGSALNVGTGGRGGRSGTGGAQAGQLRISSDRSSNSLVIRASADDHAKIAALITEMDAAPAAKFPVRVIMLKNADAARMAEMLRTMFQAEAAGSRGPAGRTGRTSRGGAGGGTSSVVIEADERAGMLLIRADDETFTKLQAIVTTLDVISTKQPVVKIYPVKNADVPTMVSALQQIFSAAPGGTSPARGRGRTTTGAAAEVPTVIIGDENARKIVVSAAEDLHPLIASTIREMDAAQTDVKVTVKVYRLEHADATTVASALDPALSGTGSAGGRTARGTSRGGTGGTGQLRISADRSSNALVVRASAEDHARIAQLIAEMDVAPGEKYPVRTIALNNADAETVAGILNTLFAGAPAAGRTSAGRGYRGRTGSTVGGKGDVVIQADAASRMILVRADDETFGKIQELVAKLDTAATGLAEQTLVPLQHADASAVAAALTQAFAAQRGQRVSPDEQVSVVAEVNSNSLIVTANARNLEKVKALLAKLDTDTSGARTELMVLKHARATDLAPILSQVGATRTGGATGRYRGRGAGSGGAQGVTVSADAASNALVVTGPGTKVDEILKMAAELDKASEATAVPVVKMYPLKNADVQTAADYLQRIVSGTTGGTTGGVRRGTSSAGQQAPIVIIPDEPGRRLIVSAPADRHEMIAKVVGEFDASQTGDPVIVKVYKIENSDATTVATALTTALGADAGTAGSRGRSGTTTGGGVTQQVRITADRGSNSVIVRAPTSEHERIARLIEEIDVSAVAKYPVQMIPLTTADPTAVAAVLNRVFGGAASATSAGRGRRTGAGAAGTEKVLIEPDVDSRMIVVRADPETFTKIRELAAKLDIPAGKATRTLLPIQHGKADLIASALTQAFAPQRGARVEPDEQVSVVADTSTNAIIVTANTPNLEKVKALLAQLDTPKAGTRTELLLLKAAKAVEIAPVLTGIVSRSSAARGRRTTGAAAGAEGVTISADAASNGLIVSGPSDQVDEVMQMALQLDKATVDTISTVEIIPLKNGDAVTVAAMIRDLYSQQEKAAKSNRQSIDPLAISADERANALVVATTKAMHEKVARWVADMEQMKPARGTMRLIQLENIDPTEVEKAIQQLFNSPAGGARGPRGVQAPPSRTGRTSGSGATGGRVQTSVLSDSRSILINASDEDFEIIRQLAEALDKAQEKARLKPKLFVLKNADNTRVAAALMSMYRTARGAAARPEDQVTVTALEQTNAVVVSAADEKMKEVESLIAQLDRQEVAPQLEFRIYPLKNALPTKVLPALTQMLNQIRKLRPNETIDIQADERTRSIIVTAKGTVFEQVEKVIQSLDKPPAHASVEVLIIPLKKADATRLATVLTDMLTPVSTGLTPEARSLQEQIRLLKVRSTAGEDIPELDLTKPIKITADPTQTGQQGSNALVITSTPENLKAMKALVELMDTVPIAEDARVRLLHLKNADAVSVMTILKDIFTQGERLAGRQGTSVAGKAVPEGVSGKALVYPLNVSADVRTNTLVLSGIEETLALAELIVADLDRENGKIVTEVRLFQLKHANAARLVPLLEAVFGEPTSTAQSAEAEGLRTQVTRLRTALKDKLPKQSLHAKTRPALTIQADEATNILIVAARSDIMPLIADVLQTMDIPGAGSLGMVRIFPLANADAPAVKEIIDSLHSGPNAGLIRDEDKPTVVADNRTNALVVAASEKTTAVLKELIAKLDAKVTIDVHDVRLITLANAEASTLAPTLQEIMDARVQRQQALGVKDAERLRMIIAADERSNSLIVGGGKEGFELVKALATQLDDAPPALGGTIQLFPLVHADSGTLATTLSNLFDQRYQAARTPDVQRQKPIILPDPRTNSLLVSASADDSKTLASLLKKLDIELVDPAVRLEVIPLKHNDAAELAPAIQQIFQARLTAMTPSGTTPPPQSRVDVTSDALSNSLIVSASKENLKILMDLLAKVDVEPPVETGVVRIVPLKNSDAQRIATMIQNLIQQGIYKPGITVAAQRSEAIAAREKVAVVVDVRTNSLILSASPENFAVLSEMIRKLDSAEDFGLLGDVRMYVLKNASATELGPTLQNLFDAKRQAEIDAGGSGMSLSVSIIPDARTNTLLVAGSRESFKILEAMLKTLDGEKIVAATVFKVFHLKNATATAIQPTLDQLFSQRATRGQTREPVTIIADPRSNTLIVGASPSDMKMAESLIAQLDENESKAGARVTAFPLEKADASAVAETLRTLFQAQGTGQAAGGGVTIGVDERTNTLLVSGGEADIRRIRELVKQLDREQVTSITEIRVFTLQHADATELADVLTSTLTEKPTPLTARSENRQTLLQFVSRTKDGKELIATALQEGVLITPDARSNSLVVVAPVRNMPLLDSLVHALDATSPRMAEIRVFPLINADAQRMATVLTELFRLQGQQNPKAVSYTLVTTQPAAGKASATIGSSEQDALNVTVDVRTNSLIVGGTKRYVELAAGIIQELDSSPAQERVTKVYRLRNAQAVDIQTAMRNFLDQENQRLTQTLGTDGMGSAHRLLEHEVAVVAEERTNALLLSASPRYFETIENLIKELDEPPPQVLVQVLLAIVKLTDNDDLGIDWQLDHKWDNLTKSVAYGTNFGVSASTDGFSLAVTAGDLRFFLRALQRQNRLEILSRPQILASDNQPANINVGSRVPFITQSRVTDQGTTINTIQYEDIGIILNVTPRINPEGFVSMQVAPEISSLSSSTVTISEGVEAVVVDRRSAETTVTVQDGHTIIIGGLIETKDEEIVKKVPFLGDLELIGPLFRSIEKTKERSELLIILTPHVMRDIPTADRVTDTHLDRMKHIRNFKKEQIEDYLKQYLEEYLHQAAPRDPNAPATQPATRPARPIQRTIPPVRPVSPALLGGAQRMPWELPEIPRAAARPQRALAAGTGRSRRPGRLDELHAIATRGRKE